MTSASDVDPAVQRLSRPFTCPDCGGQMPPEATTCPHCRRPVPAAAPPTSGLQYEDKTLLCLPYELERTTRAEAVDGWYLVDTTASEAVPEMIEAHFRRPVRLPPTPAPPPGPPPRRRPRRRAPRKRKPARRVEAPTASQGEPEVRPPRQRRHTNPNQELLFLVLLLIGVIWAADRFGIFGLILAVWLLPQLLRGLWNNKRR